MFFVPAFEPMQSNSSSSSTITRKACSRNLWRYRSRMAGNRRRRLLGFPMALGAFGRCSHGHNGRNRLHICRHSGLLLCLSGTQRPTKIRWARWYCKGVTLGGVGCLSQARLGNFQSPIFSSPSVWTGLLLLKISKKKLHANFQPKNFQRAVCADRL